MRKLILSLIVLVASQNAFALRGTRLDLHGYLRTGVGSNDKGGDHTCIVNDGGGNWVGGNEFRLGNECDKVYSELTFVLHNIKPKKGTKGPRWKTQFLWAYKAKGNASWEDTKSDDAQIAFREAFVEGSNLFGKDYNLWIGKRFYRDVNVNMNDWYYFAEMSGNGAGISNIDTGFGKFAFAMIHQTDASTTSDIGSHKGVYYDFRLFDVPFPMLDSQKLNFWLVHGDFSTI